MQGKGVMRGDDTFGALQHPSSLTVFAFYGSWCFPAAQTHCMANEIPESVMSKGLIQKSSPEFKPFIESILILYLVDTRPDKLQISSPDSWYTFFFWLWCSVQVLPPLVGIRYILPRLLHHVGSDLKFACRNQEFQMSLNFEPKVREFQKVSMFGLSG